MERRPGTGTPERHAKAQKWAAAPEKRWGPTAGGNIVGKNPSKIQARSKTGADFGVKKFNLDF
ncbi:hypothetical protein [Pricia sp.]|uniref:hypothetical protein n=1 Tax=Pricia sp. TaxID=2268138 RepID=UPI003593BFB1